MHLKDIKKQITSNFSKAANDYNAWALVQHETAVDLIAMLSDVEFKNVLDIGCGTGFCIEQLEKETSFLELTGLDFAADMIDYCKRKWSKYNFICHDAETFCSEEKYDLIVSNFTAQWFLDIRSAIKKYINSCLAPNGVLLLSIPIEGSLCEIHEYSKAVTNKDLHLLNFVEPAMILDALENRNDIVFEYTINDYKQTYLNPLESLRAMKKIGASYQDVSAGFTVSEMRRLKSSYFEDEFSVTYKVLLIKIKKGDHE